MRRFVLGWKALGHEGHLNAHIVNYADDFVICCRGTSQAAGRVMRDLMARLRLTVNEAKTHTCVVPDESFDFLGYTIGRCYCPLTGRRYIGTRPSAKRVQAVCKEVSEITSRRWVLLEAHDRVTKLNRLLRGWANYFCLGPVSKAYRAVERHARKRLRQWLCAKHKVSWPATKQYPEAALHDGLGLVRLTARTRSFPWATS